MIAAAFAAAALLTGGTPSPEEIASFYAGKPVRVETREIGGRLGTTDYAGASRITLSPEAARSLEALAEHHADLAGPSSILGLTVLIHEALHTRGPATAENQRGPDGFFGWDDEWQAHQLSLTLIPDALQRFYGIPNATPLGQRYEQAATSAGYGGTLGSPEAARSSGASLLGNRTCWL